MNDAKDLEIARLKGQVEALEKQIARLSPQPLPIWAAAPVVQPTYVPMLQVAPPFDNLVVIRSDLGVAAGNAACAAHCVGVTVWNGQAFGGGHIQ